MSHIPEAYYALSNRRIFEIERVIERVIEKCNTLNVSREWFALRNAWSGTCVLFDLSR